MTLKQFLKAGAGIVLALLLKSTGLVFFIKWPLMAVSALGGIALAFVPFQDRPLETWVVAFLKSIYSPTIYLYKKTGVKNWLDIDLTRPVEEEKTTEEELPTKDEKQVHEFIVSLPTTKQETVETTEEQVEVEELPKVVDEVRSQPIVTTNQPMVVNKPTEEPTPTAEVLVSRPEVVDLQLKTQRLEATGEAIFGSIPMPDTPEAPNMLVGMVTNKEGKIVEEAIIEIQDSAGNPVRVLKTNALGQFKIMSPLANGKYLVITEKEGSSFARVNIELKGAIVEPIRIIATA